MYGTTFHLREKKMVKSKPKDLEKSQVIIKAFNYASLLLAFFFFFFFSYFFIFESYLQPLLCCLIFTGTERHPVV